MVTCTQTWTWHSQGNMLAADLQDLETTGHPQPPAGVPTDLASREEPGKEGLACFSQANTSSGSGQGMTIPSQDTQPAAWQSLS